MKSNNEPRVRSLVSESHLGPSKPLHSLERCGCPVLGQILDDVAASARFVIYAL